MKKYFKITIILFTCIFIINFTGCNKKHQHQHELKHYALNDATCTKDGTIEYWECTSCKLRFSDEHGKNEVNSIIIEKKGHTESEWVIDIPATCEENGRRHIECTECQVMLKEETTINHELIYHEKIDSTCTTEGKVAYYECLKCEKYFSTEKCTSEITRTVIYCKPHPYKEYQFTDEGHYRECSECDFVTAIYPHEYEDGNCIYCLREIDQASQLEYKLLDDNTYEVVGLKNDTYDDIVIPKYHNKKLVTKIAPYAFYLNYFKSIEIANSVNFIGEYAFNWCSSLEKVKLPDGITSLERGVFACCRSLKEINIPDSVTVIDNFAFSACRDLIEMLIPDSVTYIGEYAFLECRQMKSIILSDNITYIGSHAFDNCVNLKSIILPSKLTIIENNLFYDCINLTTVEFSNNITSIEDHAFYNCKSLRYALIPNSVITINTHAFAQCKEMTIVDIPNSVKYIKSGAFSSCEKLRSVYIDSLESWCNIEFTNETSNPLYYADNLYLNYELVENLIIPETITCINEYAFNNCTSIKQVNIPASVKEIKMYAFSGCTEITDIYIENNSYYDGYNNNKKVIDKLSFKDPKLIAKYFTDEYRYLNWIITNE